MNTRNTKSERTRRVRVLPMVVPPGEDGNQDPQERWLTYVSILSAQGARSMTWSPVPGDTVAGDLFVLHLPGLVVPEGIRQEMLSLGSGQGGNTSGSPVTVRRGSGELGASMEITKERLGFGPFGSELDSEEVRIPVHPVFDPSRKALGRGLLGLALAHREAREAEGGSFEARLGTVVPFPDVVSSDAVHGLFGGAWDGLDSSSPSPSEYELPEDHLVGFKYFLKDRFADPGLDDAVLRLFEMSTRMRGRREAYPQSLQPPERWDFRREDERSEESREERVEAARRQKAEWEAQEELSSEEEAKGPDIDLGGEE